MTYNIYALSVAAIALGVLFIYGMALVVACTDVELSWEAQKAEARGFTYLLCLAIAVLVFAFGSA